jgi:Cu/Ag efflux pump CusA
VTEGSLHTPAELPPILGRCAEGMKRIAAPMIGGIFTSFLAELLVYPVMDETRSRRL